MPTYRGVVQDKLVRVSDRRIQIVQISTTWMKISFPTDVLLANVQATNRFIGDRITLDPLTVWSLAAEPRMLYFERPRGTPGFFCFIVETFAAQQPATSTSNPKKRASAPVSKRRTKRAAK